MGIAFYCGSIILSLYIVYLLSFKMYSVEYDSKKEQILFPNIIYILFVILAFIPILNIILCVAFLIFAGFAYEDGVYIDTWLFKKPKKG